MAVTFSASAVFRAVDMISAPARRMESAMGRMNKAMGGLKTAAMGLAGGFAVGSLLSTATSAMTDYNESVQSLGAITGLTGKAFEPFERQIKRVGDATKKSYVEVAKSMELIGSAKPELLGNAEAMGQMTEATILLSKASGMDLETSTGALTKAMNQFGVGADQAIKFVDILSTSEQKGTATTSQIVEALVRGGSTAKTMGMDFDETNAFLQAFAKAGVVGSEAGTMMAAVLSKGAKMTRSEFNPTIVGAAKAIDNMAKANLSYTDLLKITDAEGAKFFATLINQNDTLQALKGTLHVEGNAMAQADIRAKSFNIRIEELTNRFKNLMINGSETSGVLNIFGGVLGFITNNLGLIIGLMGGVIAYYVMYKTITLAVTAVTIAKNVALGISIAMHGGLTMALRGNAVALGALKVVSAIATAAQWVFNAALYACPLVWIVAAIMAVIGAIVLLVKYWDKLKAKMDEWSNSAVWQILSILVPVMKLVELIAFMQDRWNGIKKAFKEGGFLEGIKAIGRGLLSFLLKPIEIILGAVAKLTGAQWAKDATKSISDMRAGFDEGLVSKEKPVNKDASVLESKKTIESNSNQNLKIDINDPNNRANVSGNLTAIPVMVNSTRRM